MIQIFHPTKEAGKNLNKIILTVVALNVLFISHDSEEIKVAYKSKYNYMRKNQLILLMINAEAKNCLFCGKKLVRVIFFEMVKR